MLVLTVGSFSVFGEIFEITLNYQSDLGFQWFPLFLFSLYILSIYQGLSAGHPLIGDPPYQAGAASYTRPGRPGPCPGPGRAGRPMPRPMCWALPVGPLRGPPPPAPRTGAPRPPHMGRGMGRPARPGPGHGPGRPGPVWGMGQAYINIYRHRFVTNRVQNRAHARIQPRFYVEFWHASFRPSQKSMSNVKNDEQTRKHV